MTPTPVSRWAVSFADLALLLLGFFVLLYAGRADVRDVAERARAALDSEAAVADEGFDWAGTALFESGAARPHASSSAELVEHGQEGGRNGRTETGGGPVRDRMCTDR